MDELLKNLDKKTMSGLEIGPFYSPVAPKAYGWKTTVIDFQDGEALRADARRHSVEAIRMRAKQIEDVDIVWRGEPLDELALSRKPDGYDYFIASHVIEHAPDLLGFFQQVARLLRPGGIVSLAVPDMRKCFDVLKPPSSMREVLAAYREKRVRHTPETLFEARAFSVNRNGVGSWLAGSKAPLTFTGNFDHAWQSYQHDLSRWNGPYVDAHAWFFTPASFELLFLELNYMGLTKLAITSMVPSHGSEFIVQMRAIDQAKISLAEFDAKRLALSVKQIAEIADEMVNPPAPKTPERETVVVEVPVEVPVYIEPQIQSTAELARLLAKRVRRKALSLVGLS
jgi:SAM-dependent methyltransferase